MRRLLFVPAFILMLVAGAWAQTNMEKSLMDMEKQAWTAFGKGDSKFFEGFLSDDSMLVDGSGASGKTESVKMIAGKPCTLNSFNFNNFKVTMLNTNTALVTYDATQNGMCGTMAMPAKVYASSVYVKRKGKWLAAFHQESAAMTQ